MEINLLPWREEIILYNKKLSVRLMLAALIFSGFFLIIIYHAFFSEVAYVSSYTQALEDAKTNLVSNVKDYLKFKETNQEVIARVAALRRLLDTRFTTMRILNEITEITPKGIYLTKLSRKEGQVELSGLANSNLLITQFMKGIETSHGLQTKSLKKVEKADNATSATQFDLTLGIKAAAQSSAVTEEKKETVIDTAKAVVHSKKEQAKNLDDALGSGKK